MWNATVLEYVCGLENYTLCDAIEKVVKYSVNHETEAEDFSWDIGRNYSRPYFTTKASALSLCLQVFNISAIVL